MLRPSYSPNKTTKERTRWRNHCVGKQRGNDGRIHNKKLWITNNTNNLVNCTQYTHTWLYFVYSSDIIALKRSACKYLGTQNIAPRLSSWVRSQGLATLLRGFFTNVHPDFICSTRDLFYTTVGDESIFPPIIPFSCPTTAVGCSSALSSPYKAELGSRLWRVFHRNNVTWLLHIFLRIKIGELKPFARLHHKEPQGIR